jgi:hypothetical protein
MLFVNLQDDLRDLLQKSQSANHGGTEFLRLFGIKWGEKTSYHRGHREHGIFEDFSLPALGRRHTCELCGENGATPPITREPFLIVFLRVSVPPWFKRFSHVSLVTYARGLRQKGCQVDDFPAGKVQEK